MSSIKSFLESVAEYRDYEADFRLAQGCAGKVIVCVVSPDPYVSLDPLELICMGWEEAHALRDHHGRTCRKSEDQKELLELSDSQYTKAFQAIYFIEGHNKKLRADLLEACGLEES